MKNCAACNAATDLAPTTIAEEAASKDATQVLRNLVLCADCQGKVQSGALRFRGGKPC